MYIFPLSVKFCLVNNQYLLQVNSAFPALVPEFNVLKTLWSSRQEFLATDPEVPGSIPRPTRFSEKYGVRRWLHTAAAWVRVRAACGVCGGQRGTGACKGQ
jgi:hypothetical protein